MVVVVVGGDTSVSRKAPLAPVFLEMILEMRFSHSYTDIFWYLTLY